MEYDELVHYGVKGMKWGVRRKIAKASRRAAQAKSNMDRKQHKMETAKHKIQERANSGKKASKRLVKKYQKSKDSYELVNKYRDTLIKDLSKKDILQGERYLRGSSTFFTLYGGLIGYGANTATENALLPYLARRSEKKGAK